MEEILNKLGISADSSAGPWISFAVAALLLIGLGSILHRILMSQLHSLAKKTGASWDDDLVNNISKPTYLAVFTAATFVAIELSKLPFKDHALINHGLKAALIIFMFWTIERIIYSLIRGNILLSSLSDSTRGLVSGVLRVSVLVVGVLMILDSAGISITPLLASLGVGSVAVALALQDTLTNLFSGLYILADKPFRIGDYIEIEGGIQGYVTKIGWRSTHVRMLSNNIVVVPNSKMASTVLTNFDMLDHETSLLVPVGVSYDSDLSKVERVTIEVAKQTISKVQGGVASFDPYIRYKEFADSSINFNVILRAEKYDLHFILRHEFIKDLHAAYKREGIEIPYPQRVVHMKPN